MLEIVLYTRNECCLCHEMEDIVAAALPDFEARFERIAIDGQPELEAHHGTEVPVLYVNQRKAFKYRCTPRQLRKRLLRDARR
jgi:hypothetical protein